MFLRNFGLRIPLALATIACVVCFIINDIFLNMFMYFIIILVNTIILSFIYNKNSKKLEFDFLHAMAKIQHGDLTNRLDKSKFFRFGNIANGINSTISAISFLINSFFDASNNILDVSRKISNSIENVNHSIQEINLISSNIAVGTQCQAEDAQNGAALVNNLSYEINNIYDHCLKIIEDSKEISDINTDGINVTKALMENYEKTLRDIDCILDIINQFSNELNNIKKVTNYIESMSSQTSMLSLNASIEAKKAREYGQGFSIIASNIKKLAFKSKEATKDINFIMRKIHKITTNAEKSIETLRGSLNIQEKSNNLTKTYFEKMTDQGDLLVSKIADITYELRKIQISKDSVLEVIENISSVTEQTAAASDEMASSVNIQKDNFQQIFESSKDLVTQIFELNNHLFKYKLREESKKEDDEKKEELSEKEIN